MGFVDFAESTIAFCVDSALDSAKGAESREFTAESKL